MEIPLDSEKRATPRKLSPLLVAFLVLAMLLGLLSLWRGLWSATSDFDTLGARWQVAQWRQGTGLAQNPDVWRTTRDTLQSALAVSPQDPQLYDDLGFLYADRAMAFGSAESGSLIHQYQQQLLAEAIANYRTATTLRPTFPYSWVYLALSKSLRGEQDAEMWSAFDKALKFGRSEPAVQQTLVRIAFSLWPQVSAERKMAIVAMVDSAHTKPQLQQMAEQAGIELSAKP
jgi:hypothetical protein